MIRNKLEELFANDPLGLLNITEEREEREYTQDDHRLISSFEEINNFYEENGCEPQIGKSINEFMLASRLQGIRNNPQKVKQLCPFDFYDLLKAEQTKSVTLEDILGDDPLNLLNMQDSDESIFSLKHVKKVDRIRPDYISRRNKCENFEEYKAVFNQIHKELKNGLRKLVQFNEKDLVEGKFFVLRGVLLYLEKSEHTSQEMNYESGFRIRRDGRTKCIFDNGTESNMLLRSLYKALLKDGFSVSERVEKGADTVIVDTNDVQNGYIYVLKSLSANPQICEMENLYKIGKCNGDVTERIKNASKEPTYLMSEVQVVLTIRCYNLHVLNLEGIIHSFFKDVNISFEIVDDEGKKRYPKEWFVAPLEIIEEAIELIVAGEIDKYQYNASMQMIIKRKRLKSDEGRRLSIVADGQDSYNDRK